MDENEFDNQRENKAVARVIISFLKYEEYALKEIYNLRVKMGIDLRSSKRHGTKLYKIFS